MKGGSDFCPYCTPYFGTAFAQPISTPCCNMCSWRVNFDGIFSFLLCPTRYMMARIYKMQDKKILATSFPKLEFTCSASTKLIAKIPSVLGRLKPSTQFPYLVPSPLLHCSPECRDFHWVPGKNCFRIFRFGAQIAENLLRWSAVTDQIKNFHYC